MEALAQDGLARVLLLELDQVEDHRRRAVSAEQVAEVDAILDPLGLKDSSRNWRRIVAGQRLWYFESRDAKAWLMI